MDIETKQHLKEYRKYVSELKERLTSTENLIADILQKDDDMNGEVHKAEHDFPNFRKYDKADNSEFPKHKEHNMGTDI